MTEDVVLILSTVLRAAWYLFTSWFIPGTRMTPASMALFVLTVVVSLRFFKRMGRVDDDSSNGGK